MERKEGIDEKKQNNQEVKEGVITYFEMIRIDKDRKQSASRLIIKSVSW